MIITEALNKNKLLRITVKIFIKAILLILKFQKSLFIKEDVKDVLVISLHKIGDTVFTIPSVKYLYEKYKENLVIYCFESNRILYQTFVNKSIRLITVKNKNLVFNRLIRSEDLGELKKNSYKMVVDLTGSITSVYVLCFLKSKLKLGFTDEYFYNAYHKYLFKKEQAPLSKMYFDVIKLLDVNADINNYTNNISVAPKTVKIVINPFAGWKAKEWELENFIYIYKKLSNNFEVCFILDKFSLNDKIIEKLGTNKIKYIISDNLEDLISKLKNFTVYVGNDSGPMHIAAYLGLSTFTIYGPTNPIFHQPIGKNHDYVVNIEKCSPTSDEKMCKKYGGQIGCDKFICILNLTYDEVYKKLLIFINSLLNE
jgi:ADP-heptose:LPS heptosyltransferase